MPFPQNLIIHPSCGECQLQPILLFRYQNELTKMSYLYSRLKPTLRSCLLGPSFLFQASAGTRLQELVSYLPMYPCQMDHQSTLHNNQWWCRSICSSNIHFHPRDLLHGKVISALLIEPLDYRYTQIRPVLKRRKS